MKRLILAFSFLCFMVGGLPASAGWNFHSLRDLEVNIEYSGYPFRNSSGDPVYLMGSTMRYRVTVTNHGKRPFKGFPVSSVLYWSGAVTCTRFWLDNQTVSFGPLQSLVGSESGERLLDIDSMGSAFFDAIYVVPNDVCPNRGEVRVDADRGGGKESLRIPMGFEIRR